ncbi:MAG: hypothetical protein ABR593_02570 [Candidatus Limnocylindria bacterium]
MRIAPFALVLILAACVGTAATSAPPDDGDPVLVIADGGGAGDGISVADALGHQPTDDLVSVTGALFVDPDGTVRLCDAIAESFPPQCGGSRLMVRGLDPASMPDLQEANGVRWAEQVQLLGTVALVEG